jgi:DNA repair exonuclease SbcCD ATPase subunit
MAMSVAMFIFPHCERGVWDALRRQMALLAKSNEQLA